MKTSTILKTMALMAGLMLTTIGYAQYFVDFEGSGETKGAYASGTVNLSGLDWNMTEVLIGTDAGDWKNGLRSARLRGYGISAMTMLADKADGLGNISFYYKRYGTDAQVDWKVEYSTNAGVDWTQIGSAFTAPASDVVQVFSETVNITGNVRIRIKRATETGTSNRRMNIDDILLTDYTGGTPTVSTPTFNPPAGNYYSTQFVEISTSTDGATIYYTDDGTDPDEFSTEFVLPIEISSTTTLKARAYRTGYVPSNIATAVFTFPSVTDVTNIAALRLGTTDGTIYRLTGEAIVTYAQTFRNQKFIQDATAAILIDDIVGIIQGSYATGNGMTDVVGTLNIFSGMLQFTPVADADGPFTPAGSITPTVITMLQLVNDFEDFESQLVTIEDVNFTEADGVLTFSNGTVYNISDGVTSGYFRASFFDVDYIGEIVPVIPQNITGILNEREAAPIGKFITARNLADIEAVPSLVEPPVSFTATTINSNQINLDFEVNANGDDVVIVYNSTGIFSDPSGDPPAIDDPFAGGTLLYYGTESPQIHSGLAAEEAVYYRAFSYDKEFYSPGLNANATTYAVEPSNHVTGLSATANSASSITVAWTDSDATGYLIKGSTVDFNDITAPVDGISEADGALVKNVAAGVESHEFTGLAGSTQHFFKIFPYNGVGAAINYKTDGLVPQASATTLSPPQMADVLIPQYIQGLNGTNNNRVPYAFRVTFNNLTPNADYRYINQVVNSSDLPTVNGAGNPIFVNDDNTFTRTTSPGFITAGTYGEFTTDVSGSYTGWFIAEPTGNARFTPGSDLFMRIRLNDGNNGTLAVYYFTTTSSAKAINFGTSTEENQGTGVRSISDATPKNFIFLYDNFDGTGRPIMGTFIENEGTSGGTTYIAFYQNSVDGVDGAWGGIIPNINANGVRRIEERSLADASLVDVHTSEDGIWGATNTVNPTGGTTALVIDLTTPEVPENRPVDNVTLGNGDVECYDATNNITVTNTTIGIGASVEFRAGVNIIFGDGFSAEEGSYVLATITDVYCTLPPAMLASEEIIVPEIQTAISETSTFKVYPNPNTGVFALELSGVEQTEKVTVEIYGMMGEQVLQSDLSGSQIYQFDMSAMPRGVYILRIMHGGQAEVQRIIKQ